MYNYYDSVKKDIKEFIEDNIDYMNEDDLDNIYDIVDRGVLGGNKYFDDSISADKALVGNYGLLREAIEDFNISSVAPEQVDSRYFDMLIRDYVFSQIGYDAIDEALESI